MYECVSAYEYFCTFTVVANCCSCLLGYHQHFPQFFSLCIFILFFNFFFIFFSVTIVHLFFLLFFPLPYVVYLLFLLAFCYFYCFLVLAFTFIAWPASHTNTHSHEFVSYCFGYTHMWWVFVCANYWAFILSNRQWVKYLLYIFTFVHIYIRNIYTNIRMKCLVTRCMAPFALTAAAIGHKFTQLMHCNFAFSDIYAQLFAISDRLAVLA